MQLFHHDQKSKDPAIWILNLAIVAIIIIWLIVQPYRKHLQLTLYFSVVSEKKRELVVNGVASTLLMFQFPFRKIIVKQDGSTKLHTQTNK